MCERCAPDSGSAPHTCLGLWGPGTPCRRAVGASSRASFALRGWVVIFGHVARRWSMNGADMKALEVFWRVLHNGKGQSHKTPGGAFCIGLLCGSHASPKRNKSREAEPVSPSGALVTMEGGNALNRAYECCRTYHTRPMGDQRRAVCTFASRRGARQAYAQACYRPLAPGGRAQSPSRAFVEGRTR